MEWTWDVNDTLPSTATKDTLVTRSINLMCYLLKDTTYNELYKDSLEFSLNRILANLSDLPPYLDRDANGTNMPIKGDLEYHLENIRRNLRTRIPTAEDTVVCGNFFHVRRYNTPGRRSRLYHETVMEFRRLRGRRNLDHFCIPFMRAQLGSALLKKEELTTFLDQVGGKTLFQLFTELKKDYTAAQRKAIKAAKANGILASTIDATDDKGDFQVMIVNLKNNHKCVGGVCQDNHPGYWCNAGDNNQCTAASDD